MKKKLIYSEILPYDVIAYVDSSVVELFIVVAPPRKPEPDGDLAVQVLDIEDFLKYPEIITEHKPLKSDLSHCRGEVFAAYFRRPTKKELKDVKQKILNARMVLLSRIENLANRSNLLRVVINKN